MRWAIYYSDGSRFTSDDGGPEDAPGASVLGIGQEDTTPEAHNVGAVAHSGDHFYAFDVGLYGGWYGLDYFGLAQYLARPGLKVVKLGESTATERYRDFLAALREDPMMPEKSARYPWERRAR